ncbi:MAG: type VI secretion system tip protein VgrG [Alphaproteobacteria bacterium]|nr:type VI secretion system tip protein VgrG [Alphaproteobacteria bacterium]
MSETQSNAILKVHTALGEDALVLVRLQGEEEISGLFRYTLEMISDQADLDLAAVIGTNAAVEMTLSDGSTRWINGVVVRFIQAGTGVRVTTYFAELRPWLWMLKLGSDCRIYQQKAVPDILTGIFDALGFSDYALRLEGSYDPREYCVQYHETALDFVCRLMEDEGIFWFFEHSDSAHTLVIADAAGAHEACPGLAQASYGDPGGTWRSDEAIQQLSISKEVVPTGYALSDFNFEVPSTDLTVKVEGQGAGGFQHFEYPGGYGTKDAGEGRARLRIEASELPQDRIAGSSTCRAFTAGYAFELVGHNREDVNGTYVLRRVTHSGSREHYSNSFEAFPKTLPFRPLRSTSRPVIHGAQTATVVGKSGEEIWTDQHGRIKVQFHWDRYGTSDENSSCWIRVAQRWAGKGWGMVWLPRIGQEVIVSFLDGDPDRPLVTGSVYNGEQTPPYPLPDEQTKSTLRSDSSKGGGGFNELRFEDKKDEEEVYLHAQKDLNVEVGNDETDTVKNNRTVTIQEGDETLVVEKGNRKVQVSEGGEKHSVKGARELLVVGAEKHTNQDTFTHEVAKDYNLNVDGNLTIAVIGNLKILADGDVQIEAGKNITQKAKMDISAEATMNISNKATMNLTNEANVSMTNKAKVSMTNDGGINMTSKASAMQTVDGGGMLTLKGGLVKIN